MPKKKLKAKRRTKSALPDIWDLPKPGADGFDKLDGDGSVERVHMMVQSWGKTRKRKGR